MDLILQILGVSLKLPARFPRLPERHLFTDSGGNGGVGHGIECHGKVGTIGKRDDGRVPRITQFLKATGLRVFGTAEMTVMRRRIEGERDVRITQEAARAFRERRSLGQIFHRDLQRMRRIQLRADG